MSARLLLVELLYSGSCSSRDVGVFIPFIHGLARSRGVPVRSVIGLAHIEYAPRVNRSGCFVRSAPQVSFAPGVRERLRAVVEELAPTHVVACNAVPGDFASVLRGFEARTLRLPTWLFAGARVPEHTAEEWRPFMEGACPSDAVPGREVLAPFSTVEPWLRWLGVAEAVPEQAQLVDHVEPCYLVEHLDEEANALDEDTTILGAAPCLYARPVRHELLDGETAFRGCTFCTGGPRYYGSGDSDPLQSLSTQLGSFLRDRPALREAGFIYRVRDARLLRQLEGMASVVDELGIRNSTFSFSLRIDDLLRNSELVAACLPRLAAGENSLEALPLGLESFSEAENRRLNKGITPDQIDRVLELIGSLEEAHPRAFSGRQRSDTLGEGEISCIIYTPWTTLEDISENLAKGERYGFPFNGRWLTATLYILPGTAIEEMALAQGGVLQARYDDPGMEIDLRVPNHPDLVRPWSFLDPGAERFFRVISRVAAELVTRDPRSEDLQRMQVVFKGDPLYELICRTWREGPTHKEASLLRVAQELLPLVRDGCCPGDDGALVAMLFERLADALGSDVAARGGPDRGEPGGGEQGASAQGDPLEDLPKRGLRVAGQRTRELVAWLLGLIPTPYEVQRVARVARHVEVEILGAHGEVCRLLIRGGEPGRDDITFTEHLRLAPATPGAPMPDDLGKTLRRAAGGPLGDRSLADLLMQIETDPEGSEPSERDPLDGAPREGSCVAGAQTRELLRWLLGLARSPYEVLEVARVQSHVEVEIAGPDGERLRLALEGGDPGPEDLAATEHLRVARATPGVTGSSAGATVPEDLAAELRLAAKGPLAGETLAHLLVQIDSDPES